MANTYFGIDISLYNTITDWSLLSSSINFCYVKASQGRTEKSGSDSPLTPFTDRAASQNVAQANVHRIRTGAYHVLTARTVQESRTEAKFFINFLNNHRSSLSLAPAIDVESVHLPTNTTALTNVVDNFIQVMKSNGYDPIIYTSPNWLKTRFSLLRGSKLWLAKWGKTMPSPKDFPSFYLWQYGTVNLPGVKGEVDANIMVSN